MTYVAVAYGLTVLLIGGYALSIVIRGRRITAAPDRGPAGDAAGRDVGTSWPSS